MLMLLAGLNYANSLALFLTFLLAGFALVAMHLCHRNLLGVQVRRSRAAPLFAGSPGVLRVELGNPAGTPRLGLEAAVDGRRRASRRMRRGRARLRDAAAAAAARRGRLRIERVRLSTAHPVRPVPRLDLGARPARGAGCTRPARPAPHAGRKRRAAVRPPGAHRPPATRNGPGCASSATATRRGGRLEAYAREAAAAGEGILPRRGRAPHCSTSPPCRLADTEARLEPAGALDRGRGGAGRALRPGPARPAARARPRPRAPPPLPCGAGRLRTRARGVSVPDTAAGVDAGRGSPRPLLWACAALGGGVLLHADRVPAWAALLALGLLLWRVASARRGRWAPALALRALLALALVVLVLARFRTLNGLAAGTTLLILMAGLKLLETRTRRDYFVLVGTGLFLLLAACLDRQDLLRGAVRARGLGVLRGAGGDRRPGPGAARRAGARRARAAARRPPRGAAVRVLSAPAGLVLGDPGNSSRSSCTLLRFQPTGYHGP